MYMYGHPKTLNLEVLKQGCPSNRHKTKFTHYVEVYTLNNCASKPIVNVANPCTTQAHLSGSLTGCNSTASKVSSVQCLKLSLRICWHYKWQLQMLVLQMALIHKQPNITLNEIQGILFKFITTFVPVLFWRSEQQLKCT